MQRLTRGSVVEVALATLLPALLLTVIVMDLGSLAVARGQLRHALEAAVLAGIGHLDGTEEGVAAAVRQTVAFASYNQVGGWPVAVSAEAVRFGYYEEAVGFVPSQDFARIDSIALDVTQPDFGISVIAGWLGIQGLQLRARAQARTGALHPAGGCDCFLPLAVPECVLHDVGTYHGKALRIGVDAVGWATPGGPVSADEVVRQLYGPCLGPPVVVGSDAGLMLAPVTTAVQAVGQILEDRALEGPILLVASRGSEGCGDPIRFEKASVTGFVWGRVSQSEDSLLLELDLETERAAGNRPGGVDGATITWQDHHELY